MGDNPHPPDAVTVVPKTEAPPPPPPHPRVENHRLLTSKVSRPQGVHGASKEQLGPWAAVQSRVLFMYKSTYSAAET